MSSLNSFSFLRCPAAWLLIVATTTAGCGGCFRKKSDPASNRTTTDARSESDADLAKLKMALAATENLEPGEAETLWKDLRERYPDDPSIALNRALNAVLRVDALTAAATDAVNSAEEKKAARSQLASAIQSARDSIVDYATNSGDAVTELWLTSRVDAHEAALLGTTIGRSLRIDLFDKLTSAIDGPLGKDPRAVILGGPLIELLEKLSDPVDGLPDDVLAAASESLRRLSDQNEDNLFLAIRALRLAIDVRDTSVPKLADRTWQLAKAVQPTLAAYTKPIGLSPEQLVDQVRKAAAAEDWAKADQSFVLWSNVLNPLEIVRTDRRRTSPHPLDRLNYDAVRRISAQWVAEQPIKPGQEADWFGDAVDTVASTADVVLPVDVDLDLRTDLVWTDESGTLHLHQKKDSRWQETATVQLPQKPIGIIASDLFMVDSSDSDRIKRQAANNTNGQTDYSLTVRHDTLPTLIAYGDFGVQFIQVDTRDATPTEQRLQLVSETTGLESLGKVTTVTTGDLEGDGDLDLILAPAGDTPLRLFINRGNRTFFEVDIGTVTVPSDDDVVDLAIADLDRDIDLDVVTIHRSGRIGLLENLLHLQFRLRYLDDVPPIDTAPDDGSLAVFVEDVDANVGWDVIATSAKQSLVAFGNSSDIGVWTVDRIETGVGYASPPRINDFDNDSYLELITADTAQRLGPWGINLLSGPTGIDDTRRIVGAGSFGSGGGLDLVSVGDGSIAIHPRTIDDDSHQMFVRFKGIADNAAASGRVNHFGIGSVLELRFGPYYRSRIVRTPATHFGLGGFDQADSIRVIMPNGLTQTIRDPEVDSIVEEEQTLKGSCPYLYAWDGEKFTFVTDCLWAAPLGLQVAAGRVQPDRPWEYLKIDGRHVHTNGDGNYELRLTEELWEVAYVDHIELTAIDHPETVDVFSNEKVGPPQLAQPTIFAFSDDDSLPVARAVDTDGRDVTQLLRKSDERYVKGFDRRIRQGLCPPHWIDLEFADAAMRQLEAHNDGKAYLVLRGWILPTDTSLNIQIDQNPELPAVEFPSVWVRDPESTDGWRNAIPFMGFPGGKTKTIVVDVTEHINRDDPQLRVRTSAQIYWDSASLAVQDDPAEFVSCPAPLLRAEVAFHGFSHRSKPHPNAPETYDYQRRDLTPKWPPLRGGVTRFGPCTDRLADWDDSMVVISSGDEIRMVFQPPQQPVPEGWKRDFILHCVGWDKDADLNTLTGQSIDPLPIRKMAEYPPNIDSAADFREVFDKNRDSIGRRQSFRAFWHRGTGKEKAFLPARYGG